MKHRGERAIDLKIKKDLEEALNLKIKSIDILPEDELEKIFQVLDLKKDIINLLFEGNFSVNEYNIEEILESHQNASTIYDTIVNKIINKRVDATINKILEEDLDDGELVSVCLDRKLFIKKVMNSNIDKSLIQMYVKGNEVER